MQDYELIKRIRQGEKQLFGQLVEKYYNDVFRYCYYQTGNESTAYDCTQETFYHLMRFLDNYRERNHFKSYLIRIALNVCKDYFRKNGSRTAKEVSYSQWTDNAGPEQNTANTLPTICGPEQETVMRLLVRECLMHLPEIQREVIVLYYYQGYKLREIASLTGVPLSTVKTRLYTATEKLKQYLKEEGGLL